MNPLRIRATNYRTFDELDLELPEGCVAVTGENGAGKSSVVNVIDLCLFGPESRSLADYLSDDAAGTEMELELTFEHGNELYRVRRHFSAKGRGQTKLDVERNNLRDVEDERGERPDSWLPLTAENQKATQEALERLLGLSRETFRASAFLAQGDGAAFTEAKPADRKRILADALGLDAWVALLDLCRRDRRTTEKTLDETTGRIRMMEELAGDAAAIESALAGQRQKFEQTKAELVVADAALEAATGEASKLDAAATQWRTRAAAVQTARARAAELERVTNDALAATELASTTQDDLDHLSGSDTATLEERERVILDLYAEWDRATGEHARAKHDHQQAFLRRNELLGRASEAGEKAHVLRGDADLVLEHVGLDSNRCDRCEQVLGREAAERAAASYRAEANALDAQARALDEEAKAVVLPEIPAEPVKPEHDQELEQIRLNIAAARERGVKRAALEERLRGLQERVDAATRPEFVEEVARRQSELGDAEKALAEIEEPEPGAVDVAKTEAIAARGTVEALREMVRIAETDLTRIEERLDQARKLADDLATARAGRDQAQARLDDLLELERAYGRDGIPALIVEQAAIPSIETEANRILAELGTGYRVELRTEAALKSGDGTKDTLDVVVIADAGERPYETFSGGERTRINLALRVALAELLANRRGSESRLLAIDEPEFLDETGTMRLADVLQALYAAGKFDRILLISHVPTLRDALDVSLEVVKDGSRSRVIA